MGTKELKLNLSFEQTKELLKDGYIQGLEVTEFNGDKWIVDIHLNHNARKEVSN